MQPKSVAESLALYLLRILWTKKYRAVSPSLEGSGLRYWDVVTHCLSVVGKRKNFTCVEMVLNTVLKQKGVELGTTVRLLRPLSVVITCCGVNAAFHKENGMTVWDKPECLLWYW